MFNRTSTVLGHVGRTQLSLRNSNFSGCGCEQLSSLNQLKPQHTHPFSQKPICPHNQNVSTTASRARGLFQSVFHCGDKMPDIHSLNEKRRLFWLKVSDNLVNSQLAPTQEHQGRRAQHSRDVTSGRLGSRQQGRA